MFAIQINVDSDKNTINYCIYYIFLQEIKYEILFPRSLGYLPKSEYFTNLDVDLNTDLCNYQSNTNLLGPILKKSLENYEKSHFIRRALFEEDLDSYDCTFLRLRMNEEQCTGLKYFYGMISVFREGLTSESPYRSFTYIVEMSPKTKVDLEFESEFQDQCISNQFLKCDFSDHIEEWE